VGAELRRHGVRESGVPRCGFRCKPRYVCLGVTAGRQEVENHDDESGACGDRRVERLSDRRARKIHVGREHGAVAIRREALDLAGDILQRAVRGFAAAAVIDEHERDVAVLRGCGHDARECQPRKPRASAASDEKGQPLPPLDAAGCRVRRPFMSLDLDGHTALVTGGNGGIGLGMARGLAKAGAAVAVWGRNAAKNAASVEELKSLGADADSFAVDVTQEKEVEAAMTATLARFGRVDSCFANAGVGKAAAFTEMTIADWNDVVDINLVGAFLTFREAARHMIARGGGGKLVGIASIGSIHGMPRQAQYSASKAGLCAMIRSLAVELAKHGIQANTILPGWIETDMTEGARSWDKLRETVVHRTPARRWGKPEDFEGIAVYLASRASDFHTGDTIRVDGGYAIF
jgi:NAD(P)-dependent dehydrogenase (short-subunit alcohol dehydrogenase family)